MIFVFRLKIIATLLAILAIAIIAPPSSARIPVATGGLIIEMFCHRLSTPSLTSIVKSTTHVPCRTSKGQTNKIDLRPPMRKSMTSSSSRNSNKLSEPPSKQQKIIFTYQLGKSIYVPLTSKCNSITLPETRGGIPFLKSLPVDVLTSLILVRIVECYALQKKIDQGSVLVDSSSPILNQSFQKEEDHDHNNNSYEDELIEILYEHIEQIQKEIISWISENESPSNSETACNEGRCKSTSSIDERIVQNALSKLSFSKRTSPSSKEYGFQYPSVQTLYNEIEQRMMNPSSLSLPSSSTAFSTLNNTTTNHNIESIVFAGEGEPTLRMDAILSLSKMIRNGIDENIPIRVLSNGLVYHHSSPRQQNQEDVEQENDDHKHLLCVMKDAGVSSLSVALQTSCPLQYNKLMDPLTYNAATSIPDNTIRVGNETHPVLTSKSNSPLPYERICEFIKDAVGMGMDVEVTGVHREIIDVEQAEKFAKEKLGVMKPFRWRSWFSS